MIDIAIVTTSRAPRAGRIETRTGSVWTKSDDKIRRSCLECLTPNGVRLELEAFFERFQEKSFRLQIIQPKGFDPEIAEAITALVPAPVFTVEHGYRQFSGKRDKAGGAWRGTPFDYGFEGREHKSFAAFWAIEPEPMILLKSSAGDHYAYPSTDDDEAEDTTHVKNGRLGGLKKQENKRKRELQG